MGQITLLKTEIDNDPLTIGYTGMSDQAVADSLNAETRSQNISSVSGTQIGDAIDETEYGLLSPENKTAVRELVQAEQHNPFGFTAVVLKDIFSNNSGPTITALLALRTRNISRAKELGARETVDVTHVAKARAL